MSSYDSSNEAEKILKRADPSTIQDKFLVGYQGWYTCAGDGEPAMRGHHGWSHWFENPISNGGHPNTDLWPDVSSYSPSELFPAPGLKTQSGDQIFLFSSRHPKTVQRHFHWMAEHGVDGVFLQRSAVECDLEAGGEGFRRIRDEVGDRVREAAEKEGRVFAIMYDVSGVPFDRIQRILERDWLHLVHEKGVLDSPSYLKEKGQPVVALRGFGFENAGHTPGLVTTITSHFRTVTPGGVYILAGAPTYWRTAQRDADRNPEFFDVWLNQFDAICPWTIGQYRTERDADGFAERLMKDDMELIRQRNEEGRWRKIDYVPLVFPGASGFNLSKGQWGLNDAKRNGGRFLWKQISNAKRQGARIILGAMWDVYNNGTAFMPAIEKKRMLPDSDHYPFIALDEDGYDLPSDWYMRICGFAAEGLRSERRIHETFPSKELQDYWASRPKYEVSGAFKPAVGASATGSGSGQSYGEWQAMQKDDKDEAPPPPYSLEAEEVVGGGPQQMQAATTSSHIMSTTAVASASSHAPSPSPSPSVSHGTNPSSSATSGPVTNHALPSTGVTHQTSSPPPINTSSRPQQPLSTSGDPISSTSSIHTPPSSSAADTYPTHLYNNNNTLIVQDPVTSLTNDLAQQRISSPRPGHPSTSPPPLHPAHPAVQGARPHSTASRPSSRPPTRPQSQAGYTQAGSPSPDAYAPSQNLIQHAPTQYPPTQSPMQYPTTQSPMQYPPTQAPAQRPSSQAPSSQNGGTWSQAPWPPPEWGVAPQTQNQTLPSSQQPMYPGQNSGGANLTRPNTFSASSYSASPLRPHAASLSARPHEHSHGSVAASSKPPIVQVAGPSHLPYASSPVSSTYMPDGRAESPSFPSSTNTSLAYPTTSSYTGPPATSSYGSPGYTPHQTSGYSAPHALSSHNSSTTGPVSFPGVSHHPSQMPYPTAQGSSYPGQTSFGITPPAVSSHPVYGTQHGTSHSATGRPSSGDGFHFPQAPSEDSYFGTAQPQTSGYNPSYIGNNTQYGTTSSHLGSATPPTGGWYPGSSGSPTPSSMPSSQPQAQTSYSTQPNPGFSFPTASTGLLGTALNAVDKVAGRRAREQLESVTQSGAKLFNKYTR